jgi:hypothetical protein
LLRSSFIPRNPPDVRLIYLSSTGEGGSPSTTSIERIRTFQIVEKMLWFGYCLEA